MNSSLDLGDELVGIPKITDEQIKITQFLGSGAFGEVYEGYWTNGPKMIKVAIKVIISSLLAHYSHIEFEL